MNPNSLLIVAALVLGLIWFWHASMAARERANAAAREACDRLHVGMRDGTVWMSRLWLRRNAQGRLSIERTYGFDYTDDGHRRLRGFVVTLGPTVISVGLAAAAGVG